MFPIASSRWLEFYVADLVREPSLGWDKRKEPMSRPRVRPARVPIRFGSLDLAQGATDQWVMLSQW